MMELNMKRIMIIVCVSVICAACISCDKKKLEGDGGSSSSLNRRTAVVAASTNLVIRARPERTATKLGMAGHGATVEILGEGDKESEIDGIRAKWYHIVHQGTDGWVFGGYLSFPKSSAPVDGQSGHETSQLLKEEPDHRKYIGKEYSDFSRQLKLKFMTMTTVGDNCAGVAFRYDRRIVMLAVKKVSSDGEASRWIVTDVQPVGFDAKKEKLFFPEACHAEGIRDPLIAIARNKKTTKADCVYTRIEAAWTIDPTTGKFSPAMTDDMSCRPDCCGDGCI
jgi:hypothetical protein